MSAPLAKKFITINGTSISVERVRGEVDDSKLSHICSLDDFDGCWSKLLSYVKIDAISNPVLRGLLLGARGGNSELCEVVVDKSSKPKVPILMTQADLTSWIIARTDYVEGCELDGMYQVDGCVASVNDVFESAMKDTPGTAAELMIITEYTM